LSSGLHPVRSFDRRPAVRVLAPWLILLSCGSSRIAGGSVSPEVLLSQIQPLIERGDLGAADGQLSSALKKFPREPGQTDLELTLFQGLDARGLASSGSLHHLGVLSEQAEKLVEARAAFEKVVAAQTPSAPLLLDLARVAYKLGDLDGTLGYLAHARDLEPFHPGIQFFLGMVCVDLNLPIEARRSLQEAVRLDPKNPYYNYALGAVTTQGRIPSEAVPYFENYIALGAAYFYAANYCAARKELGAVKERRETAAGAHYFLGRIAKQEENLAEAESEFEQAVAANPKFPDALAELAHVHIRLEKYVDAQSELERAIELDPDSFRVNANLLVLYQKTKDTRVEAQRARFEEIEQRRSENEQLLWRTIEVRPY
jgi:tetratricopeptide (TPR) repeat protein